jgi:hypothetical protein
LNRIGGSEGLVSSVTQDIGEFQTKERMGQIYGPVSFDLIVEGERYVEMRNEKVSALKTNVICASIRQFLVYMETVGKQ